MEKARALANDVAEKQNLYLQRPDIVDSLSRELAEIKRRGHRYAAL
jgi:hypothetical protein